MLHFLKSIRRTYLVAGIIVAATSLIVLLAGSVFDSLRLDGYAKRLYAEGIIPVSRLDAFRAAELDARRQLWTGLAVLRDKDSVLEAQRRVHLNLVRMSTVWSLYYPGSVTGSDEQAVANKIRDALPRFKSIMEEGIELLGKGDHDAIMRWRDGSNPFLNEFDRLVGQGIASNLRQASQLADLSTTIFRAIIWAGVLVMGLLLFVSGWLVYRLLRDRNEALSEAHRHLWMVNRIFENTQSSVIELDTAGRIVRVNPAFTRLTGYVMSEVAGKSLELLNSGRQSDATYRELWQALREKGRWVGDLWNRTKNGAIYRESVSIVGIGDRASGYAGFVVMGIDASERPRSEDRMAELLMRDALTNLHNRLHFNERLSHAVVRAQRKAQRLAVLFLDLDGFKQINNVLGYGMGDEVLRVIARRLERRLRASDSIARLGGDEFVVLLEDINREEDVAGVARSLLENLDQEIRLNGHHLFVTASIGISLYPDDGLDAGQLLERANRARYEAKAAGKNRFCFYKPPQEQLAAVL
jgi:diguanylate cyclase (GGDEF)-like protein/PAS domain S-box-containing protein